MIGSAYPTVNAPTDAEQMERGSGLARQEINDAGGVGGRTDRAGDRRHEQLRRREPHERVQRPRQPGARRDHPRVPQRGGHERRRRRLRRPLPERLDGGLAGHGDEVGSGEVQERLPGRPDRGAVRHRLPALPRGPDRAGALQPAVEVDLHHRGGHRLRPDHRGGCRGGGSRGRLGDRRQGSGRHRGRHGAGGRLGAVHLQRAGTRAPRSSSTPTGTPPTTRPS